MAFTVADLHITRKTKRDDYFINSETIGLLFMCSGIQSLCIENRGYQLETEAILFIAEYTQALLNQIM